jgi:hypothetical protein
LRAWPMVVTGGAFAVGIDFAICDVYSGGRVRRVPIEVN